ncbi:glutaredoxin domain-containing protein [Plantactinospora sp. B5E13]|uniref:glutaredoxin domain-containing protein n=1 Tax=unclassified Plantactinospora TaxID=2631981 RepID=UPI00325CD360
MLRRWQFAGLMLVCGALLSAVPFTDHSPVVGVAVLVVFCALAVRVSPLVFPRPTSAAEAQARSADDGRPIVYWRPGCRYCLRLRSRLGRQARQAYWVDIWRDPAGAAAVRAVTGGDETVPTVAFRGESFVNPDPGWLRQQLLLTTSDG